MLNYIPLYSTTLNNDGYDKKNPLYKVKRIDIEWFF